MERSYTVQQGIDFNKKVFMECFVRIVQHTWNTN